MIEIDMVDIDCFKHIHTFAVSSDSKDRAEKELNISIDRIKKILSEKSENPTLAWRLRPETNISDDGTLFVSHCRLVTIPGLTGEDLEDVGLWKQEGKLIEFIPGDFPEISESARNIDKFTRMFE